MKSMKTQNLNQNQEKNSSDSFDHLADRIDENERIKDVHEQGLLRFLRWSENEKLHR
jgi:hypothetical protein